MIIYPKNGRKQYICDLNSIFYFIKKHTNSGSDDTISSDLTEEVTNTDSIGNNTEPVDGIAFRQVYHFRIYKALKRIFIFFIGIVFKPIKSRIIFGN